MHALTANNWIRHIQAYSHMTASSDNTIQAPVAIIAGNGDLPLEIARSLQVRKIPFLIIGIQGEADATIEQFTHAWCDWEKIGRLYKLLSSHDCKSVVLAGGIIGRPEFKISKLDWGAVRTLPGLLGVLLEGDDAILTSVINRFEERGYAVLNIAELMPHLVVRLGDNTEIRTNKADIKRIEDGAEIINALSKFDVGQGCVIVGKRAVAIEGAEGTDAMLQRITHLRQNGRLPNKKGGVLVKAPKRGQDERADLPAIGPQTIQAAFEAGLNGIGVQAGKTLFLNQKEALKLAKTLKISIFGFNPNNTAS